MNSGKLTPGNSRPTVGRRQSDEELPIIHVLDQKLLQLYAEYPEINLRFSIVGPAQTFDTRLVWTDIPKELRTILFLPSRVLGFVNLTVHSCCLDKAHIYNIARFKSFLFLKPLSQAEGAREIMLIHYRQWRTGEGRGHSFLFAIEFLMKRI